MQLRVFRSLWGAPGCGNRLALERALSGWRARGLYGIECSLADTGANATAPERAAFREMLKRHDLALVMGVYSAWTDYESACDAARKPIAAHVSTLQREIEHALDFEPLHLNAHTGSDAFSDAQNTELFGAVQDMTQRLLPATATAAAAGGGGVATTARPATTLSHETHRGRSLFSPYVTARVLQQYPALKLTADFSHWAVVSERLLDSKADGEPALMARLCHAVLHTHARVGYAQGAQVPHRLDVARHGTEIAAHEQWWRTIWTAQRARGAQWTTLTPEYGPPPYALREPFSERVFADHTDMIFAEAKRQTEHFKAFVADASTAPAL